MWQVLTADKADSTLHVKEKWQLELAVKKITGDRVQTDICLSWGFNSLWHNLADRNLDFWQPCDGFNIW